MSLNRYFLAIPTVVMDMHDLTLHARIVYGILWTRANGDNVAWPGQQYLAEMIGCTDRSIRTYVDELIAKGLVTVERQGLRRTNRYMLGELPVDKKGTSRGKPGGKPPPDRKAFPLQTGNVLPLQTGKVFRSHSNRLSVREEMNVTTVGNRSLSDGRTNGQPEPIAKIIARRTQNP